MDFRYVVLFLKWMGDLKNEGMYNYFLSYVRIFKWMFIIFFVMCMFVCMCVV